MAEPVLVQDTVTALQSAVTDLKAVLAKAEFVNNEVNVAVDNGVANIEAHLGALVSSIKL